MRMVIKKHIKSKVTILFTLLFILGSFYSCNVSEKHCGFRLSEFVIDDVRLGSIIDSMVEMHL